MCDICKETLSRMRDVEKHVGDISSFAHDAKASAESTHLMVAHLTKTVDSLHSRLDNVNEKQWGEIGDLKTWKSKLIGAWVGFCLVFTAIGVGITAIWEAVKHWGGH